MSLKSDIIFTKYQFPAFGELVTLETLLEKLNSVERTVEDDQITYYGWWPVNLEENKHEKLPLPAEEYIPEIGETIKLNTPSFWDFSAGGNMELLRITENTFVVFNVNNNVNKLDMKRYQVEGYDEDGYMWQSGFSIEDDASHDEIRQAAYESLPEEYVYGVVWGEIKD